MPKVKQSFGEAITAGAATKKKNTTRFKKPKTTKKKGLVADPEGGKDPGGKDDDPVRSKKKVPTSTAKSVSEEKHVKEKGSTSRTSESTEKKVRRVYDRFILFQMDADPTKKKYKPIIEVRNGNTFEHY